MWRRTSINFLLHIYATPWFMPQYPGHSTVSFSGTRAAVIMFVENISCSLSNMCVTQPNNLPHPPSSLMKERNINCAWKVGYCSNIQLDANSMKADRKRLVRTGNEKLKRVIFLCLYPFIFLLFFPETFHTTFL